MRNNNAGVTLIELILTIGILLILSTAAIPMFQITVQHRKETELRNDLREMRKAIDRYKDDADKNLIQTAVGSQNYPPDLQTLVDGVTISSAQGATGGISASALAERRSSDRPALRKWERDSREGHRRLARARQAQAPAKPWGPQPTKYAI
jgi:prepilin-type N-terminal cleavage/methylation domain-containing protein